MAVVALPFSFPQILPSEPSVFSCDNGPSEPNAFESELVNDAADRIDRKEMLRRKNRKGLKKQWQRGHLDSVTICKKLAEKRGPYSTAAFLEIFAALEERDGKTLRELAKLRKKLTDEKFPPEPWEVEEAKERETKLEKSRERARVRAKARRIATNAVNSRDKLLYAQAEQDAEEELAHLDLQLVEEDEV